MDFVRTFRHVDCVRGISPVTFREHYQKWSKKDKYNFSSDKVTQIYADVQDQIAIMKDEMTKR